MLLVSTFFPFDAIVDELAAAITLGLDAICPDPSGDDIVDSGFCARLRERNCLDSGRDTCGK